jgi:hypothetical protein
VNLPQDESPVLSLGVVLGGRTSANAAWEAPLQVLMQEIERDRIGVESAISVNIVFHIPGRLLQPDFQGVRTGTFSRTKQLLMVQVALDESPPRDVEKYLALKIFEALDAAESWAIMKRFATNLSSLKSIATKLQSPFPERRRGDERAH